MSNIEPPVPAGKRELVTGNCDRGELQPVGDFLLGVVSTISFLEAVFDKLRDVRDGETMLESRNRTLKFVMEVTNCGREQAEQIIQTAVSTITPSRLGRK